MIAAAADGHARELRGVGDAATTRDDDADADVALVKAVLCAGAYPNVMTAPPDLPVTGVRSGEEAPSGGKGGGKGGRPKTAGDVQLRSTQHGGVHLHPCCLIFRASSLDWRHLVYHELVRTTKVYARDATTVSPLQMLLFGGRVSVHHERQLVSLDGHHHFRAAAKVATLVKLLRARIEQLLLDKIRRPTDDVTGSRMGRRLVAAVRAVLEAESSAKTAQAARAPLGVGGRNGERPLPPRLSGSEVK